MSHKPAGLIYGVDDTPPLGVNILSGLQHVGLMSIYLVYPVLIAQAAGASAEVAASLVSATLIALAVATLLQVITIGPIGSGFLCQPTSSVVYIVPSLVAARSGNLAAVFGMTMLAGLFEVALARVLPRLRPIFTPEITGLVVLLTGISVGVVGLRTALGGAQSAADPAEADLLLGSGHARADGGAERVGPGRAAGVQRPDRCRWRAARPAGCWSASTPRRSPSCPLRPPSRRPCWATWAGPSMPAWCCRS